MNNETRIYSLDSQKMTQEEMAVTFAMTSRSPEAFDEIAQRVTEEKSAEFHERWVLGYGHSSVAEHAVLHLAVENISRLACDALEDNRLASLYREVQPLPGDDGGGVPHPPGAGATFPHAAGVSSEETCTGALQSELPSELMNRSAGAPAGQPLTMEDGETSRGLPDAEDPPDAATDACRAVLPAATLTNVGVTVNARELSQMISKLLSSEILEHQALGQALLEEGNIVTPTLLKHAGANDHLRQAMHQPAWQAWHPGGEGYPNAARLIDHDPQAERVITEAISYTILPMPHEECRKLVGEMTRERRVEIIGEQMRSLGDHDPAIREFEMASMTFELVMDYGAYREFRRHRMQSCFPQPMTVGMGYRTPDLIVEAGLEEKFRQAMKTAEDGYGRIMEVCPRACQVPGDPRPPPEPHRPHEPAGSLPPLQAPHLPAGPRVHPGPSAGGDAAGRGGPPGAIPMAPTPGLPRLVAAPQGIEQRRQSRPKRRGPAPGCGIQAGPPGSSQPTPTRGKNEISARGGQRGLKIPRRKDRCGKERCWRPTHRIGRSQDAHAHVAHASGSGKTEARRRWRNPGC